MHLKRSEGRIYKLIKVVLFQRADSQQSVKPQESSGTSVQINVDLAEFLPSAPKKVRSMIRRRSFGVKEEEKRSNMKTFVSWLVVSGCGRYIEIDLLPMSVAIKMYAPKLYDISSIFHSRRSPALQTSSWSAKALTTW